jgi:hypothetical protein
MPILHFCQGFWTEIPDWLTSFISIREELAIREEIFDIPALLAKDSVPIHVSCAAV